MVIPHGDSVGKRDLPHGDDVLHEGRVSPGRAFGMPHQDKYAPFRKLLPVDSLVCTVFHINFICVRRRSDLSYVFQIWHRLHAPSVLPVMWRPSKLFDHATIAEGRKMADSGRVIQKIFDILR
jgi:hypothetical protein